MHSPGGLPTGRARLQRGIPREQHVLGLDVAVHHPALVGVGQRVRDLAGQPHRVGQRQLALAVQQAAEGPARDVGHGVIEESRQS
jgi:hypothetical protein